MTDYNILLERLKRHYSLSKNFYDKPSLYDLAHILRIWTEVKHGIDNKYSIPIFNKSIHTKSLKKIFKNSEYIYTYLPSGVTTSASKYDKPIFSGPYTDKFSTGGAIELHENKNLTFYQFYITNKVLSPDEIKILSDKSKTIPIEKVSFSKYMESTAIYFKFPNCKQNSISNEILIKRIANEYEASHPDSTDTGYIVNKAHSECVAKLMMYKIYKLPLPYFVALHIAKNIIDNLDKKI